MNHTPIIWLFCVWLNLIFYSASSAQNILSINPGAAGGAMGGIRSTHQGVLALYGNEAGLAFADNPAFYCSAERRFNTEGLNFYSLLGAIPTRFGNLGVSIFYHGYSEYNEKLLGVAYARKLLQNFSVGARFDFVQASIPIYGSTSTVTAELGIQTMISPAVTFGFHVYNPFETRWSEGENLPTILQMGLSYQPTNKVRISGEVEKASDFKANLKWGLQYLVIEELALRVGFNTQPALFSFGVGYALNNGILCDIGSTVHQELGLTPLAGFGYLVKK